MFENIALAFQGILSHKLRSFLTMLGIIIGIASIISIVSTIKGTNEQIKKNLIGSGTDSVEIELNEGSYPYDMSYNAIPEGVPVITEDVRREIEALEEVEAASLYHIRSYADGNVYYKNTGYSGALLGIDQHYFDIYGYDIRFGRGFTEEDFSEFRKVAILDEDASKALFSGENPLGKTIEISGEPFVVVGISAQASSFEPVINSVSDYWTYQGDGSTGKLFIPQSDWGTVFRYDEPQAVAVKAVSTDDMAGAGRNTADILNARLTVDEESDLSYRSMDVLEEAKKLQELSSSTNQQLLWIASISLLVGGIGVMNIMLVTVTERTREIGLKKAIGARKRRILFQFLTEAAVLTCFGGLLGVGAGIVMAQVISNLTATPTAISIPAAVIAVLFSMGIGILFGLLPAVKAANLNPIEALRRE